jgi:hypothetical protein
MRKRERVKERKGEKVYNVNSDYSCKKEKLQNNYYDVEEKKRLIIVKWTITKDLSILLKML